jgi:hypothetical protein
MDSSRTVDQIFARLLVRYGAQWIRMWEGIDPAAVKADWMEALSGRSGDSIRYALEHLPPDRPPNAGQFLALCMEFRRPEVQPKELPRPEATPADKARVRAMLAKARRAITGRTA